jgi:hypothetical protein
VAGSVERDVIYRLKAVVDPASQGAFAQMAAAQKTAADQQAAAATAAATAAERQAAATRTHARETQQNWNTIKASAAAVKAAGDQNESSSQQMLAAMQKLTHGIMDGVRAWALYGAASEKEMERAVRVIARVEGGLRAAHAGMQISEGLGGLTAAARGGDAAAITAGTAAGGVIGVTAAAGTAAVIGIISIFRQDIREGLLEFIGWTDKAGDALRGAADRAGRFLSEGDKEAGRLSRAGGLRSDLASTDLQRRLIGVNDPLQRAAIGEGVASSAVNDAQMAIFAASQTPGHDPRFHARRTDADQQMVGALQQQLAAQQDYAKAQRATSDAAINAEQRRLGLIQDQLKATNAQVEAEKQRLMSQEERLANLDPITAQQTAAAARVALAGGQLDVSQANLLGGFTGFDDARQSAFRRKIQSDDLGFILDSQRSSVASREWQAATLNANVKAQFENVIRMEFDAKGQAAQIEAALNTTLDKINQMIVQKFANLEASLRARDAAQGVQRAGRQ